MRACLALAAWTLSAGAALASNCLQIAEADPFAARVVPAAFELGEGEVGIRYVGHASFRIETPEGAVALTDYSDWTGPGPTPDIATMNKAHSSHWTARPDPAIDHVLPGWGEDGLPAEHWLEVGDMLVRNVPTDIRTWGGGIEPLANSIFIFEVGDLCIGHLGHLHHKPTNRHYGLIGRLDVLMVPVDGGYTMNQAAMMEVVERLRSRIVLPMHWFGESNLQRFLAGMSGSFDVIEPGGSELVVSADSLPARPTIVVLRP